VVKKFNKMKKLVFLAAALMISCIAFAQTRDTIRFEKITGLIKIPVSINGKIHYFMFDTGAMMSVIREDNTEGLDKTNSSRKKMHDSNMNVITQTTYVVKSLKIGKSDISNLTIITFPDSPLFKCLGVDGIIGIDIIKQFDWLIDFKEQTIVKIDPSEPLKGYDDFVAMDFYHHKLRPKIRLRTGDNVVDFLFDSGANTNQIDIKSYGKIKDEIIQSFDEVMSTSGVSSLEKQSKETMIVFNAQFGKFDPAKHGVLFNTISVGENKIGNYFWGNNQLFLSWTKNKLLFRNADPEKKMSFGITLKIENDSMVVNTLVYTDAIKISGVKIGDKVKSINGKSFKDYCELLTYQILSKETTLAIELLDGRAVTVKREVMN
jgi:hypothetical protein